MAKRSLKIEEIEFKEALSKLKLDIKSTRMMLIVFGFFAVIIRLFLIKHFPIFPVLFLLSLWFFLYFIHESLINKIRTSDRLYGLYYSYLILDLLFLTVLIHYLGGAEWLGAIFYILSLLMASLILPAEKTVILGLFASVFYLILVLLEFFEIIPHEPLFFLEPELYKSPSYVGSQILIIFAFFYFVVDTTANFSRILRQKREELIKEREKVAIAYQQVQASKEALEMKVNERTKELKELTESLEEKVKQRTKDLEVKVDELERFQKLFIGRELKMVELKEKIEELKKTETKENSKKTSSKKK